MFADKAKCDSCRSGDSRLPFTGKHIITSHRVSENTQLPMYNKNVWAVSTTASFEMLESKSYHHIHWEFLLISFQTNAFYWTEYNRTPSVAFNFSLDHLRGNLINILHSYSRYCAICSCYFAWYLSCRYLLDIEFCNLKSATRWTVIRLLMRVP